MTERTSLHTSPSRPAIKLSVLLFASIFLLTLGVLDSASAKLETWRQETSVAFSKGKREGVVISDNGVARLAQAIEPTSKVDATRVWDLARTGQGAIFAATGDSGQVFRREGKDDAPWTVAFDATDTQALSLAALPDGRVFAGTGPSGQVVEVSSAEHPSSRPDPGVQYIWDLAVDPKGVLFAATGPTGQLWKRATDGKWSLLLDSKRTHLLSVAVGPDGAVYAGSDGEGLIYRVGSDGKASVVYDAPQSDIRTLQFGPDGALYAGTAAETGGGSGGGSGRPFPGIPPGLSTPSATSAATEVVAADPRQDPPKQDPPKKELIRPVPPAPPSGGTSAPKPLTPGENAVYRIGTDGVAREVFRVKALIFALAWQEDRLLVGTGPEGQLYAVRELGRESAPIAKLDNGQILALLAEPKGGLLIGAGDPGAVFRLGSGYVARGTLTSDVLDAKLISRFGALTWRSELPEGTSATLQVRTGNVGEPDSTWSEWSAEQTAPDASQAHSPPGRFAQYRATLATRDPADSPALRAVTLRYQTVNLPPEITKIDVPDLSAGDGVTRQTKLTLRWDVNDPNGDDLSYSLHIRKEGWPDWVRLGKEAQTESNYAWDTTAAPAGLYRLRVTASDRPSNNGDETLSRERVSEPFLIDHQSPVVTVTPKSLGASVTLKDDLTRLVKAAYALDGGDWVPIFPEDGLFDTPSESLSISLPDLKPGPHVLVVRATDAAGNLGAGDALLVAP